MAKSDCKFLPVDRKRFNYLVLHTPDFAQHVMRVLGGDAIMRMSRKPEILADAAWRIFQKPKTFTGNFLIDDTFLAGEGVSDFDQYRVDPSQPLQPDFFVPDTIPPPKGVSLKPLSSS